MSKWHECTAALERDTRTGNLRLAPTDDHALELFMQIGVGKEVVIKFKKARSLKQHRYFWTLVGIVVDNLMGWTKEALADSLKLTLGHFRIAVNLRTGEWEKQAKSIAFESMDQISFQTFFQASLDELALLLGCTADELLNAVSEKQQDFRKEKKKYRTDIPAHTPIGHNSRGRNDD